ncbi:ubiquitin carboxyl-terminal hydrolase MINDY-1-like isoform X2 [Lineus longissimus]|uniref:ubiquitin carboxyl-terminal hydrolase MINDY-1-like isoform X2 n=1 Tax=Lineus longissimus TaxID=88925 RepID=UPI002B4DB254
MNQSFSEGECIETKGSKDNPNLGGENAPVVDSLGLTDDTSSSLDAVQNVQGAGDLQQVTDSLPDGEINGAVASDGGSVAAVPTEQDMDNGNLPDDLPEDCQSIPDHVVIANNLEIEIKTPPEGTIENEIYSIVKEELSGLDDVAADIPFADDAVPEVEKSPKQIIGSSDVKAVWEASSSSPSVGSGDAAGGLALPVPGCSTSGEVAPSSSSASVSTDGSGCKKRDDSPQSVYHIKWIIFKEKKVPIVTQNENGPCPLLAIVNYLLLKEKIKLPILMEIITADQLMEYLGDCVFDQVPKNASEDAQLNIEQNVHDAMSVIHKLQTGLDVNVKFTGVADFEYTSECIIFDILGLPMYHGWLVDPQSPEAQAAVGHYSYNQLVEKIITQKSSEKPELVTEALIAENFLERTASQLTYHGLCELCISIKEEELAVLFRNNHFSTIYKHKNELFLLVTDQGFLTENNVVWETLSNVEGDCNFVDADFRTYRKPEVSTHTIPPPQVQAGSEQQVDQDFLVALSLQQEQQNHQDQAIALEKSAEQAVVPQSPHQVQSDLELALQLQEEEHRQAARAQAQAQQQRANQQHLSQMHQEEVQRQQQRQQQEGRRKSGDCSIL